MELGGLHPVLRPWAELAVRIANDQGIHVTVTSVKRTWANQTRLYQNYLECQRRGAFPSSLSLGAGLSCRWPANPPGESAHEYGLAWDSSVAPAHQALWNEIRRALGWRVPENDIIHAEYNGWRQIPREFLSTLR